MILWYFLVACDQWFEQMHFAWWQIIVLLMIVTTVTDFFNASLIDAAMKYPIENARIS